MSSKIGIKGWASMFFKFSVLNEGSMYYIILKEGHLLYITKKIENSNLINEVIFAYIVNKVSHDSR